MFSAKVKSFSPPVTMTSSSPSGTASSTSESMNRIATIIDRGLPPQYDAPGFNATVTADTHSAVLIELGTGDAFSTDASAVFFPDVKTSANASQHKSAAFAPHNGTTQSLTPMLVSCVPDGLVLCQFAETHGLPDKPVVIAPSAATIAVPDAFDNNSNGNNESDAIERNTPQLIELRATLSKATHPACVAYHQLLRSIEMGDFYAASLTEVTGPPAFLQSPVPVGTEELPHAMPASRALFEHLLSLAFDAKLPEPFDQRVKRFFRLLDAAVLQLSAATWLLDAFVPLLCGRAPRPEEWTNQQQQQQPQPVMVDGDDDASHADIDGDAGREDQQQKTQQPRVNGAQRLVYENALLLQYMQSSLNHAVTSITWRTTDVVRAAQFKHLWLRWMKLMSTFVARDAPEYLASGSMYSGLRHRFHVSVESGDRTGRGIDHATDSITKLGGIENALFRRLMVTTPSNLAVSACNLVQRGYARRNACFPQSTEVFTAMAVLYEGWLTNSISTDGMKALLQSLSRTLRDADDDASFTSLSPSSDAPMSAASFGRGKPSGAVTVDRQQGGLMMQLADDDNVAAAGSPTDKYANELGARGHTKVTEPPVVPMMPNAYAGSTRRVGVAPTRAVAKVPLAKVQPMVKAELMQPQTKSSAAPTVAASKSSNNNNNNNKKQTTPKQTKDFGVDDVDAAGETMTTTTTTYDAQWTTDVRALIELLSDEANFFEGAHLGSQWKPSGFVELIRLVQPWRVRLASWWAEFLVALPPFCAYLFYEPMVCAHSSYVSSRILCDGDVSPDSAFSRQDQDAIQSVERKARGEWMAERLDELEAAAVRPLRLLDHRNHLFRHLFVAFERNDTRQALFDHSSTVRDLLAAPFHAAKGAYTVHASHMAFDSARALVRPGALELHARASLESVRGGNAEAIDTFLAIHTDTHHTEAARDAALAFQLRANTRMYFLHYPHARPSLARLLIRLGYTESLAQTLVQHERARSFNKLTNTPNDLYAQLIRYAFECLDTLRLARGFNPARRIREQKRAVARQQRMLRAAADEDAAMRAMEKEEEEEEEEAEEENEEEVKSNAFDSAFSSSLPSASSSDNESDSASGDDDDTEDADEDASENDEKEMMEAMVAEEEEEDEEEDDETGDVSSEVLMHGIVPPVLSVIVKHMFDIEHNPQTRVRMARELMHIVLTHARDLSQANKCVVQAQLLAVLPHDALGEQAGLTAYVVPLVRSGFVRLAQFILVNTVRAPGRALPPSIRARLSEIALALRCARRADVVVVNRLFAYTSEAEFALMLNERALVDHVAWLHTQLHVSGDAAISDALVYNNESFRAAWNNRRTKLTSSPHVSWIMWRAQQLTHADEGLQRETLTSWRQADWPEHEAVRYTRSPDYARTCSVLYGTLTNGALLTTPLRVSPMFGFAMFYEYALHAYTSHHALPIDAPGAQVLQALGDSAGLDTQSGTSAAGRDWRLALCSVLAALRLRVLPPISPSAEFVDPIDDLRMIRNLVLTMCWATTTRTPSFRRVSAAQKRNLDAWRAYTCTYQNLDSADEQARVSEIETLGTMPETAAAAAAAAADDSTELARIMEAYNRSNGSRVTTATAVSENDAVADAPSAAEMAAAVRLKEATFLAAFDRQMSLKKLDASADAYKDAQSTLPAHAGGMSVNARWQ